MTTVANSNLPIRTLVSASIISEDTRLYLRLTYAGEPSCETHELTPQRVLHLGHSAIRAIWLDYLPSPRRT